MTKTVLILAGATLLRVCGRNQTPPPAPGMMTPGNMAAPMAAMAPTMVAEHGGYVGQLGDTIAEVATLPDGRLAMFVRDQSRAPVQAATVTLNLQKPDGTMAPVNMTYDAAMNAYVGQASGVTAGAYPVQVSMVRVMGGPPMALTTAPIAIVPAPAMGVVIPGGGVNINVPTIGISPPSIGIHGPHIGIGGPHIGVGIGHHGGVGLHIR